MVRNNKGIAVIGIIGLVAVVGLFIAYVTGHPIPTKAKTAAAPVAVIKVTPVK